MENYRVEQMINDRGNGAVNQFVLYVGNKMIFQSYDSIIATVDKTEKTVVLGMDWDYSKTTGKHRNIFFRDYANIPDLASKKGILDALKNGLCNGWTIKFVAQILDKTSFQNVCCVKRNGFKTVSFCVAYILSYAILKLKFDPFTCVRKVFKYLYIYYGILLLYIYTMIDTV